MVSKLHGDKMSRLKQVLSAAAALVLGSALAIGVALNQAGQSEGMSPEEWCSLVERAKDPIRQHSFFIAIQPGNDIPEAYGDRLLGSCEGGTCTIAPNATPQCSYTYQYDCGPTVGGWKVCEVQDVHPYIAKGWMLAAEGFAYLRWYSSRSEVVTACLEHFTGPECLDLLQADSSCWLLNDGTKCIRGNQVATGIPCPYAQVVAPYPCTTSKGAGMEIKDAQRTFTDEEMDNL